MDSIREMSKILSQQMLKTRGGELLKKLVQLNLISSSVSLMPASIAMMKKLDQANQLTTQILSANNLTGEERHTMLQVNFFLAEGMLKLVGQLQAAPQAGGEGDDETGTAQVLPDHNANLLRAMEALSHAMVQFQGELDFGELLEANLLLSQAVAETEVGSLFKALVRVIQILAGIMAASSNHPSRKIGSLLQASRIVIEVLFKVSGNQTDAATEDRQK